MRIPANLRKKFINEAVDNGMKALTIDTENSLATVKAFSIGHNISIGHNQVVVPNKIITIQYKWLHEKKPEYLQWEKISDKYNDPRDYSDALMIDAFFNLVLDEADIIIGQNLDNFDMKMLKYRAQQNNCSGLDGKPSIDILKLSRKSFKTLSHKLDYRSDKAGLGGKNKMELQDWIDIEQGNKKTLKKMITYGLKDVTDTETLAIVKEMAYYKDLPVNVEKVILSFLSDKTLIKYGFKKEKEILICKDCKKKKKASTNVFVCGQNQVICKTCNKKWKIK